MKVFENRPEYKRKVGRPRLRLLEDAEDDLRDLKMNVSEERK
jgi:hypothetical protein